MKGTEQMFTHHPGRQSERGQVLVIVAAGMLAFIAMVALVIDGGHAWGQQRITQNGADAAAEAGAVVMAQNLPAIAEGTTLPKTDQDVLDAVNASAVTNDVDILSAEYTTFDGTPLGIDVGALGALPPPANADGVRVEAKRDFATFLAGVIGFNTLTTETDATARVGIVTQLAGNNVLPITVPVTIPQCDGSGNLIDGGQPWVPGNTYTVFLCKNGPGNVGWLDWYPTPGTEPADYPCQGQGANELACLIKTPGNPPIDIPEWYFVSQTGNTNASGVQEALETWIGQKVFFPLFDATCDVDPPGADDYCPGGEGNGQNQWYHFPSWTGFIIHEVHVSGSNAACGSGLNGGVGCIIGEFVELLGPGTLGEATGDEEGISIYGVQLIN